MGIALGSHVTTRLCLRDGETDKEPLEDLEEASNSTPIGARCQATSVA